MVKEKQGKCVVKFKKYNNIFYDGGTGGVIGIGNARIYDYRKIPEHIKNSQRYEVVQLNSEKGLELLTRAFNFLNREIPRLEEDLTLLKKVRTKLYYINPEIMVKYFKEPRKYKQENKEKDN